MIPTLSSLNAQPAGSLGYTGKVTTDAPSGTLYHVLSASATPPSVLQMEAGEVASGSPAVASGNQPVISAGVQTISGGGLSDRLGYYLFFYHKEIEGSAVTAAPQFFAVVGPKTPFNVTIIPLTPRVASVNWRV